MNKTSSQTTIPKQEVVQDLIYLCGCAVRDIVPEPSRISSDPDELLDFAAFHSLSCAAATALRAAGIQNERITHSIDTAVRNAMLYQYEMGEVEKRLQAEKIWYMPLKGAVLQKYYPRFEMREMSDRDILFDKDRAEDVRRIMESLGYTTEEYGKVDFNHDVYMKPPVLNFEMHTELYHSTTPFYPYYMDVKSRLIQENGCKYKFSDEDCYLYVLTHEYKHFMHGGTGLRSLLDTYVYLRGTDLDLDYVKREAEKLGIADFEAKNRQLAMDVFDGSELDDAEQEMLEFFISCGLYGSADNAIRQGIERAGMTRLQYILHRFSVPLSRKDPRYIYFAEMYPLFYRYKILLPFLPFYRLFRAIKEGRFSHEARIMNDVMKKERAG